MGRIMLAVSFMLLLCSAYSINCSATHFDFNSIYTLGKQDELNKTFEKIQEKITSLEDVVYNSSEVTTFTISNVNPSFYYRDSKQRAVIRGQDTIIIDGGYLQVDFTFDWSKKQLVNRNGTGSAQGLSFEIIFAKQMVVDEGFYSYQLLDAMPVSFDDSGSAFKLTRIDPPSILDEDKQVITKILNHIPGNKDVRTQLQKEIQKYFILYLRASLHDQHQPIDKQFDYKWYPNTPGKNNVTISMIRRPVTVDIEKQGIQATFDIQIENDTNWKCGNRSVPISPFDPRSYGGAQQFISFDYYQSVLRYAIQKNLLDTDLTRQNWQNRMFQFYAGDLYEIIPSLQTEFYAASQVTGSCQASYDRLKVQKSSSNSIGVYIHYDCSLLILKKKIVDFSIELFLDVTGEVDTSSIDFKLKSHEQAIKIYPYGSYRIYNEELAEEMIKSSLNRLYNVKLFGSGFPLSPPRDYPLFGVESSFTVIYDPTQVPF